MYVDEQRRIGLCNRHKPGEGVIRAIREKLAHPERPFLVESQRREDFNMKLRAQLEELRKNISDEANRLFCGRSTRSGAQQMRGFLYCYFVPDGRRATHQQYRFKCGRADNDRLEHRLREHEKHHTRNHDLEDGQTIKVAAVMQFPFHAGVDSFVKKMLKWWQLPGIKIHNGGTEWYYISLDQVRQIWNDALEVILNFIQESGLLLNELQTYKDQTWDMTPWIQERWEYL